ncbi:MAG TPA: NEW3 domain-containing protein [Candidatus Limnocylindrales bacterium]
MTRTRLAAFVLAAGLLLITGISPVAVAAATFNLTTPYPAVTIQSGNTVTFTLDVAVPTPERVDLAVSGTPSGWTANLRGGGNIVNAVFAGGSTAATVDLSVTVPQAATPGSQTLTVTATSGQGTRKLPIEVTVLGATGGAITLASAFPQLSGAPSSTFTYSVTLANTGTQKQTYTLQGQGPDGWTVSVHPSSNAQALTDTVDGGGTDTLSVTAQPPTTVAAGAYPLQVTVSSGGQSANTALEADVTGAPAVTLGTPNQVLNAQVTAGSTGTVSLVLTNSGSTVLQNVAVTAAAPTGWTTTFAPATIATIQPGGAATLTATVKPSSDALAGDYAVTFTATAGTATANVDIRTTVQTSPLWGFIGLALIALVLIGLGWVFRRFGRR